MKPAACNHRDPSQDSHASDFPSVWEHKRPFQVSRGRERDHTIRAHRRVRCPARTRKNRAVGDKRDQTC